MPYSWPYVHLIDNLTAFLGALALPCGTAFYLWGHEVGLSNSSQLRVLKVVESFSSMGDFWVSDQSGFGDHGLSAAVFGWTIL